MPRSVSLKEVLKKRLQNPEFVQAYLDEALHDDDPKAFLVAMRRVMEARQVPVSVLAKNAKCNEKSLYRTLSENGNPEWSNLKALMDVLGIELSVQSIKPGKGKLLSI